MPSSYRHPTHMSHGSSASLESQLASQLQRQATVASASESSLSLGRRTGVAVASQLSLDGSMDVGQGSHKVRAGDSTGQLGAPSYASSYASSHGGSIKRSANGRKSVLPSIGDYGEGHYEQINPMFRVVSCGLRYTEEALLTSISLLKQRTRNRKKYSRLCHRLRPLPAWLGLTECSRRNKHNTTTTPTTSSSSGSYCVSPSRFYTRHNPNRHTTPTHLSSGTPFSSTPAQKITVPHPRIIVPAPHRLCHSHPSNISHLLALDVTIACILRVVDEAESERFITG